MARAEGEGPEGYMAGEGKYGHNWDYSSKANFDINMHRKIQDLHNCFCKNGIILC